MEKVAFRRQLVVVDKFTRGPAGRAEEPAHMFIAYDHMIFEYELSGHEGTRRPQIYYYRDQAVRLLLLARA